ncbi:hypothetical protein AKJ16_DCAP02488 [Drosera capensis]
MSLLHALPLLGSSSNIMYCGVLFIFKRQEVSKFFSVLTKFLFQFQRVDSYKSFSPSIRIFNRGAIFRRRRTSKSRWLDSDSDQKSKCCRWFDFAALASGRRHTSSALVWQCFYLGAAGTIHYGSSLLSGVIIAMALPVTEIAALFNKEPVGTRCDGHGSPIHHEFLMDDSKISDCICGDNIIQLFVS